MKRKIRDMSPREYMSVSKFITDILADLHVCSDDDHVNCAWLAFMTVYREDPDSFISKDSSGWIRAYQIIIRDIELERKRGQNRSCREISIERPSSDDSMTLDNLISSKIFDYNSVIYAQDFVSSLDAKSNILLDGLLSGRSISQISNQCKWQKSEAKAILHALQDRATEYFL